MTAASASCSLITWGTRTRPRDLRCDATAQDGPPNLVEKVERRGAERSRHQRAAMITGHREVFRVRKGRCQLVDRIVLGSRDEQRRDRGQVGACIERFGGQRFDEQQHLIPVEVGLRNPGCEFGELGVGRLRGVE